MPGDLFLGDRHDMVRRKAEFCEQTLERRRGAERVHADDGAPPPHIACPAERRRLLHRDARRNRVRKHLLAIGLVLLLEQLPGWHADDARRDALRRKLFGGGDAERNLAARADQDHLRWRTAEVGQYIGAARNTRGGSEAAAVKRRQRLPAQDQAGGLMLQLQDVRQPRPPHWHRTAAA